ncbi:MULTISPECIES: efflux RND transporter permease subunit [unclassified Imperialibacter]|uniref:efflux RND transporter permease subunit n=1 Tax=unclassified Imperialibacter TaxID=2629706 RepID=UPI001255BCA8|nr:MULTISPECIES: efflux RND transporter permease subunit [unclassified Imperialibacter]CAD5276226.1 Acriflavin resistance protein [Imperialibacter sp. 89]CAD5295021.1 Acriflavin resistance protein [Imperialibacter sp. 75]VVT26654.1 Acriflavin resistance protein [Imperialibacter sp. EC-SDR9]
MAGLSNISINRPVLAVVMSIIIIIFGIIGFNFLGIREYPSVDPPIISVSTSYTGANASIIESQITEPLEESINGIAGIKSLTSTSRDGASSIRVEFDLEIDLEAAANDVRDRVSRATRNLPPDCDPPSVRKADADAMPLVFLNVKSDKRTLLGLSDVAENIFKERLQTIKGVAAVQIWGERRYSMRLWMDPAKLAAYSLTPLEVLNAVTRDNVELPSGLVEGTNMELTVRTMGRISTPEEFNQLIVKEDDNNVVRFQDVGRAELGPENNRTILKRDGVPMVGVVLQAQPGTNIIEIVDEFYRRLEFIKKDLPADIELGIGFDVTEYVRQSITEVQETIFMAFVLVVLIIFAFLRDWRTTLIPVATIPISLIGTFFIMYLAGFTINVLTLLGIVLSIGLVVDDTIVVLENIYTKIEDGMSPLEAGLKGSTEIFFAVISTTVALVAVFMPVVFLDGLTGRLFREFGIVVAGAVIISSFVALTLTPMLSTKILKKREKKQWLYRVTEPFFDWMNEGYNKSLENFMARKWLALVILVLSFGGIYLLNNNIQSELSPMEDRGEFRINSTGPEGATFEYMDAYLDKMLALISEAVPEKEALISMTSPSFGSSGSVNSGNVRVMMVDPSERTRSQQEVVNAISPLVMRMTEARSFVSQSQSIGNRRGGLPVQYVIQATTIEKLKEVLPAFVDAATDDEHFDFVDLDLKFTKPEINIEIDRDKARSLNVSIRDVAQTLQLGLSGSRFGYFIKDGKQYQIIGQVDREDRNDPLDLKALYVKNQVGDLIQMDNLVKITEQSTPPQLYRYNRFVSATVSASLVPGYTIKDGIDAMDAIAARVLDGTFQTELSGPSAEFRDSSSSLYFAFIFALILIYLVLAAQFESFRDPFIIMLTVPMAIAGAFLSLWYFDQTLNIFSQIGIIMLIGLVTKNGILIVEFANQRKAHDMPVTEAIVGAAQQRFRPILMTSLSTILGILPIALALGAGSESRVSMGIAIIGGLLFATILTLYVIPAMYVYISGKEKRMARF